MQGYPLGRMVVVVVVVDRCQLLSLSSPLWRCLWKNYSAGLLNIEKVAWEDGARYFLCAPRKVIVRPARGSTYDLRCGPRFEKFAF